MKPADVLHFPSVDGATPAPAPGSGTPTPALGGCDVAGAARGSVLPATGTSGGPDPRWQDLSQMIAMYNQVTERLQQSHEALRAHVDRLQEQLASKDAQLQRSKRLAALGEMAAGIAHEVRNPLAAIQLYAGMIAEDLTAAQSTPAPAPAPGSSTPGSSAAGKGATGTGDLSLSCDHAKQIIAAVRGLDAIVRDVLTFAREITPRPRLVTARELIDQALSVCQADLQKQRVTVRRQGPAWDEVLHADADLLRQALVNLITNAVQAMAEREAGTPATLTFSARREGARLVLAVRDSGPGLAPGDIDRIFNPFFTTRAAGTGLGLAIVHRIADVHGGAISAANHPRGGAVFELSLPVAASAEPVSVRRGREVSVGACV